MDWAVGRGEENEEDGNTHDNCVLKKLKALTGGDGFAFMSSASCGGFKFRMD